MLKQKYFLTGIFILSAERQPIKLAWRKIVWLLFISPHPDDIAYSCFGTIFNTVCDPSSDVLVSIFTRSVFPKYDKNCPSELEDEFSHERVLEDQNFCMWMKLIIFIAC